MADTIRTKSSLLALLADNTTGDISPQDLRDIVCERCMGVYGGIWQDAADITVSGITNSVAVLSTIGGAYPGSGVTYGASSISPDVSGLFLVELSVEAHTASNAGGMLFWFRVFKNGAEITGPHIRTAFKVEDVTVSNGITAGTTSAIISLTAGDILDMRINANSAIAQSLKVRDWKLVIRRVG